MWRVSLAATVLGGTIDIGIRVQFRCSMKPLAISPDHIDNDHIGMIITRDQPTEGKTYRKGHKIAPDDLVPLAASSQPIHAILLEEGDVPESIAVPRIAEAIRGEHTTLQPMVQGRINIRSSVRGLLRIDTSALLQLNLDPEIGIFTHYDSVAVDAETMIAGVKIAPVAMDLSRLDAALGALSGPIVNMLPFQPLKVVCIVTEALQGRVRDRFEQTLQEKMDWYGADLQRIVWLDENPDAIEGAIQTEVENADLLFTAGSHMMDPLDPILVALEKSDAEMVRLGAPAHPGSMVWVAWHEATQTPILSLASCSMFSRSTVADLLMPHIFAGERVTNETFAALGHGGLLDRGMDWRFPPYRIEP